MKFKENIGTRVLLLSIVALFVPLLFFPKMFGTQLFKISLVNFLYELVFYGFVLFLFNRRTSLRRLIELSGICLGYRLVQGIAFGFLIAGLFNMNLSISLRLGLLGYVPSLVFYAMVTPFILKPVLDRLGGKTNQRSRKAAVNVKSSTQEAVPIISDITHEDETAVNRDKFAMPITGPMPVIASENPAPVVATFSTGSSHESSRSFLSSDINGFERAVRYIGEHGSVHLATIVDHEGLMLSNFKRGAIDPEAWAPLALVFFECNRKVLDRTVKSSPEKIDIALKDNRVVIARINRASLMVVAERQSDDLLNIRINQGIDIIKKYMEERYSRILENKVENINVPSIK